MSLRSYLRGAGLGILVTALVLTFGGVSKTKAMTDDEVMARAKELGMTGGNEVLTEAYTMATAPEVTVEEKAESEPPLTVSPEELTVTAEASTEALTGTTEASTEALSGTTEASTEALAGTAEASTEMAEGAAEGSEKAAEGAAEPTAEKPSEEIKSADEIIEDSLKGKQTTELKSDITGEDKTKSELLADAAETEAESASPVTEASSGFISIHINSGSTSTAIAHELEKAGAVSSASAFDGFLCANGYDRRLSTGDFRIPAGASDEEIAKILMRR